MGWRETLFGRTPHPRRSTWQPERRSAFETLAGEAQRSRAERARILRGLPPSPQRVCAHGHVVPYGSPICSYGHVVG